MAVNFVTTLLSAALGKYVLLNCCFELTTVLHIITVLLAILTPLTFRLSGVHNGKGGELSLTSQEDWKLERGYIASILINCLYCFLEIWFAIAVSFER
jgi:hypothetical protein